ncbi:MAG: radical SAM family heme chaperone HemW, partial [Anaerolineae bacterium]|nr:radical SAM family heme chaperone HemW [Anaerolineae bacterium]
MTIEHALYLHIPFCQHRCAYCDFTTYAGQDDKIPAYVDALIQEIELVAATKEIAAKSIFFGGGTPSLLTSNQLASLMDALCANFDFVPDIEISLEANPGTVAAVYLQELHEIGFNRISFGVQSAHPDDLLLLERIHDFLGVVQTVHNARQAGFKNLSLDLIFGLPEQSLSRWQETLRQTIRLHPEHLSIYALTIEEGTPFGHWADRGMIPLPDPDLAADMYEWASEFLEKNG